MFSTYKSFREKSKPVLTSAHSKELYIHMLKIKAKRDLGEETAIS